MRRDSLVKTTLIALIGVLLIPLLIYGYFGTFARFSADDYCYTILPPQHDYRFIDYLIRVHQGIHGRFSASGLLFFMRWFDPRYTPLYSLILILAMVAALAVMFYTLMRRLGLRHTVLAAVLLAEMAVVVMFQTVIKGDATIGQTLFWRSASMVYTPPKILMPLLIALIIDNRRSAVLIGTIAFIAGGFSETYGVMAIALIGVMLPLAWLLGAERRVTTKLIAAMFGTTASMTLMFASVTVQSGRIPRLDVLRAALDVIQTTFWMSEQGVKASPFAFLLLMALPATLVRVVRRLDGPRLPPKQQAVIAVGLPVALIVAVMVSLVPGVLSGRGVPARALTLPYYLIMIVGIVWSMLALPTFRFGFEGRYPQLGQVIRTVGLALTVAIVVGREIREAPARIASAQWHAAEWDAQDAAILAAKARGENDVIVEPIGPLWLTESIGPNPGFYVNSCAAFYYGLETLRAP